METRKEESIFRRISLSIKAMDSGTVFSISDFIEFAEPRTVSRYLARIADAGEIERLVYGVFWKPSKDSIDVHDVARAISRNNNWLSAPCGDTALLIGGLDNRKTDEWTFITSGTDRVYEVHGHRISFRHTASRILEGMSEKTALFVQMLKAFGSKHLSEEYIGKIMSRFKPSEIAMFISETKYAPQWVKSIARRYAHAGEQNEGCDCRTI